MFAWRSKFRALAAMLLVSCLGLAQAQPRVITLSPHATEMVFAAGAGDLIVATVQSSNFPPAAQDIARIGDGLNTGIEQVLAWQPDLVIGWPSALFRQLEQHGIHTYTHTPESIPALIQEIETLGQELGTLPQAQQTAAQLSQQLDALAVPSKSGARPRVIVLAGAQGDYVIGRDNLINDAIERCGGINPFASELVLAPKVSLESIISSKPDLIVTGHWPNDRLQKIAPIRVIDADLLYRPGPRFLEATRLLCEAIGQL